MAVNLRLRPETVEALRAESDRTGLSQQEILRRAVDEHLGLTRSASRPPWPDGVEPPAEEYRDPQTLLSFPPGRSVLDILDELREERL